MNGSLTRLLVTGILATLPTHATAQVLLTDAIAVVADPVTLSREIQADATPFEVHVVYTNPASGTGSISALQFGLELDPGLSLLGATTTGLMIEPAPLEYALAFPDCFEQYGAEPFVALTAIILRSESAAPGAGIRLRGLDSSGEPARAVHCGGTSQFAVIDFGGVLVNPATPTVAGFASSPTPVVEGRDYELGWATAGGGTWAVDGSPVDAEGALQFTAGGSTSHTLTGGASPVIHQLNVIREPQINSFAATPDELPNTSRVSWDVAGAARVDITGMGQVARRGSRIVDTVDFPVIELAAVNEWGTSFEVIEFVVPTAPPVILEFAAEPSEFFYGEQIALSYRVEGATEVRIDPAPGRVPLDGEYVVLFPTEAATYTLTASNSLGFVTAQVVLDAPTPDIQAFWVWPEEFGPGEDIELRYAVVGADSIWMEPDLVLVESSGDIPIIAPIEPTTYTLVAENAAGRSTRDVVVTSLPPKIQLTYATQYTLGLPVRFTWYTWRTETLTLMPGSIPLEPNSSGELTVYPEGVQTWGWVATNAVGTTMAWRTLSPGRPGIISFEVEPNPGVVGQAFDFIWRTWGGATEIAIEGVPGLMIPGSEDPNSGRVTHIFDEPYEGRPVLVASNSSGASRKWLSNRLDVRESDKFIDFFHEWNVQIDTDGETYFHWSGVGWAGYEYEGVPVPWNGTRHETLPPGTHSRVLTATYLSVTETDTAWVTIDPIGSFEVDGPQVSPDEVRLTVLTGEDITLTWNTPGASRASISPGIGDVDTGGGEITVPIVENTDYILSAWYDGEREVIERGVHVSRPVIDQFEFSSEFVRPDESVILRWKVRGADLIRIENSLGDAFEVAAEDSLFFPEPLYAYWVIRAYSSSGGAAAGVRMLAPYVEVNEFFADPDQVVLGEPTTLRWDVAEVPEVEIIGVGTFPPQGELELIPPDSRGYELIATGPTDTEYRVAPVRVDVDASHPAMITVSAEPNNFVDGLQALPQTFADGMPRYDAWVRIENVLGSILYVSYALEVPD
ncbi:MAG: hypothetical protein DRP64_00855, partial [Verrucomicrobia bacterium]